MNKAEPMKMQNLPLNNILKVIYSELLRWFGVLTVIFISILSYSAIINKEVYLDFFKNNASIDTTIFCGSFNGEFFGFNLVAILFIIFLLLLVSMVLINGKPRTNVRSQNSQMIFFMLLSTSTLCIYILMTGGFLDSPFSSTLSIYLAGFLLMQDRKDNSTYNKYIIIFATLLVLLPYFILSWYNLNDLTYFFDYSKDDTISNLRLILSYGLAIFSIYSGHRINNKINKLYE